MSIGTNEAAKRLSQWISGDLSLAVAQQDKLLDEALAGERIATVELAASVIAAHGFGHNMPMDHDDWRDGESAFDHIRRHLDEVVG